MKVESKLTLAQKKKLGKDREKFLELVSLLCSIDWLNYKDFIFCDKCNQNIPHDYAKYCRACGSKIDIFKDATPTVNFTVDEGLNAFDECLMVFKFLKKYNDN